MIIQQKMIGDVLATSILFEVLKSTYPNSELHYVINSRTYHVVENNPFIDRFHFVTPEIEESKMALLKFCSILKKEHFDVVIDVYGMFSSNLMSRYSGAAIRIAKYKWYSALYYTHTFKNAKTPKTNAGLAIENRLQLLQPIVDDIPESVQPKVYLKASEIKAAKDLLSAAQIDLKKPLFMISVIGSGDTKTYPLPHMAKLIDEIVLETDGTILFNYIPSQEVEAVAVYNFCKSATKKHIYLDIFGKSLREFLALTSHCTALIGNEGGAVNMAKALNVPTFTIFSPWIKKEAWNMFENGTTHVSIHLKDVKPELYDGKTISSMKADVFTLYQTFPPSLIIPKLKKYLQQF